MTISRDTVAHYLDSQFSALAAAVAQADSSEGDSGYGADIDNALRQLGNSEDELADATVENGDRAALFALAEFYAARRFWRLLGDRVSHTMGETTYRYESQRAQAKEIMDEAKAQAVSLGYDVTGSGWSSGWLNLDWAEAEIETGA